VGKAGARIEETGAQVAIQREVYFVQKIHERSFSASNEMWPFVSQQMRAKQFERKAY
jgi:hypothetical protein